MTDNFNPGRRTSVTAAHFMVSVLYAAYELRIESWSKFVSEAYWNVELAE